MAASAGGVQALCSIVAAIPSTCTASYFVVLHIGEHPSRLPNIFNACAMLPPRTVKMALSLSRAKSMSRRLTITCE